MTYLTSESGKNGFSVSRMRIHATWDELLDYCKVKMQEGRWHHLRAYEFDATGQYPKMIKNRILKILDPKGAI